MGKKPVSDLELLGMEAGELSEFIDRLEPAEISSEQQAELLAQLPPADPDAPITVVTSLRLPYELKRRIEAAAAADRVSVSTFIRSSLERVLAGRDRESLVNLDDVIRAVRNLPHAA